MLSLNVRRNFGFDQKVFKRLVLPVGDNWRLRIYLTESIALSYKLRSPCFIRSISRLGVAELKVVMKGKTFLDVFLLFCRVSFRDENVTSGRIF